MALSPEVASLFNTAQLGQIAAHLPFGLAQSGDRLAQVGPGDGGGLGQFGDHAVRLLVAELLEFGLQLGGNRPSSGRSPGRGRDRGLRGRRPRWPRTRRPWAGKASPPAATPRCRDRFRPVAASRAADRLPAMPSRSTAALDQLEDRFLDGLHLVVAVELAQGGVVGGGLVADDQACEACQVGRDTRRRARQRPQRHGPADHRRQWVFRMPTTSHGPGTVCFGGFMRSASGKEMGLSTAGWFLTMSQGDCKAGAKPRRSRGRRGDEVVTPQAFRRGVAPTRRRRPQGPRRVRANTLLPQRNTGPKGAGLRRPEFLRKDLHPPQCDRHLRGRLVSWGGGSVHPSFPHASLPFSGLEELTPYADTWDRFGTSQLDVAFLLVALIMIPRGPGCRSRRFRPRRFPGRRGPVVPDASAAQVPARSARWARAKSVDGLRRASPPPDVRSRSVDWPWPIVWRAAGAAGPPAIPAWDCSTSMAWTPRIRLPAGLLRGLAGGAAASSATRPSCWRVTCRPLGEVSAPLVQEPSQAICRLERDLLDTGRAVLHTSSDGPVGPLPAIALLVDLHQRAGPRGPTRLFASPRFAAFHAESCRPCSPRPTPTSRLELDGRPVAADITWPGAAMSTPTSRGSIPRGSTPSRAG